MDTKERERRMGNGKKIEKMTPVGQYISKFNALTGQTLPLGVIYQSAGLLTHVQKRHPKEVSNLNYVSSIISDPDYIGRNPNEPNSIELIKILGGNVMVCVKLDVSGAYYYVASVFEISQAKLNNRLNSGRLRKC